jgi:hypothetical protein
MVTIQNAQIYSMNGEFCYEIEYTEGTKVRAVESKGNFIRAEYKDGNEWRATCKPYIVNNDKRRNAEKIRDAAKKFIN